MSDQTETNEKSAETSAKHAPSIWQDAPISRVGFPQNDETVVSSFTDVARMFGIDARVLFEKQVGMLLKRIITMPEYYDENDDNVRQWLEERVSQVTYDISTCGLWTSLVIEDKVEIRKETWEFYFRNDHGVVYLDYAIQLDDGIDGSGGKADALQVPNYALEVITGELTGVRKTLLGVQVMDTHTSQFIKAEGNGPYPLTFDVTHVVETVKKVIFGSIVEGVDETTSNHEVALPATKGEIWKAMEAVEAEVGEAEVGEAEVGEAEVGEAEVGEAEVGEAWSRTHGCPWCLGPVDPDCPNCHGEGITT